MTAPVAILTDTTLCTGCSECVTGCKEHNKLGKDQPRPWKQRIDDLSSTRFTTILRKPGARSVRQLCRHCLEPACASACPVGALQKTELGPVIYDSDRCIGCRYCMTSCPYGIPRYTWEETVPYVRKCTMCYDRLQEGGQPACVEACPEKATIFGTREELLAEAKRRIAADPERYQNKVYGETEVGGTSVLYISDIPLDFLSYSGELAETALPERTWAALSKVPPIVLGMGGAMTGLYWFIGRRQRVMAAEAAETAAQESPTDEPAESRPSDGSNEEGN